MAQHGSLTAVNPDVSVVIPVRNRRRDLERCLRSVDRAARGRSVEIIVVDGGSSDGSREAARAAGARLAEAPAATGPGALRNAGAREARGAILAFVDADHEVDARWIDSALAVLSDPGVAVAGAPCVPPPAGTWVQRLYGKLRGRARGQAEVEWLGSGNMFVRRSAFQAVSGFDERLETCEDVDLCMRPRAARLRLVSDDRIVNIHHGDPATLQALFRGELWRGRNNLRVSLRATTLRSMPSILIPVIDLVLMLIAAAGVVSWSARGSVMALAAVASIVALSLLRPLVAARRGDLRTVPEVAGALILSVVFDCARSLALFASVPHRVRTGREAT
jgi:GT2 family glycosyltransferase